MKRLYFDTETTGLPNPTDNLDDQPHIVQVAAILVDDEKGEVLALNVIVKPDGWEVPAGAAAVHGISTEDAANFGIPVRIAMATFSQMCRQADQIVAHNIGFDLKLVGYELRRLDAPNVAAEKPQFCTMDATTDLCRLPGKYGKFKWPKLTESHQHIFGESFEGAHDALADVRACQRVHEYLIGLAEQNA